MCVCVCVCAGAFYALCYSPRESLECELYALNDKLTRLILKIGVPSYYLT